MAREKVKGFDANGFIESVRESAVPTYHTAADADTGDKEVSQTKVSTVPKSEPGFDAVYVAPEDEVASKYSELNIPMQRLSI